MEILKKHKKIDLNKLMRKKLHHHAVEQVGGQVRSEISNGTTTDVKTDSGDPDEHLSQKIKEVINKSLRK